MQVRIFRQPNRKSPWMVRWWVQRRQKRKFFATRGLAQDFRMKLLDAVEHQGKLAAKLLSGDEMREYRKAIDILRPLNVSLLAAAQEYAEKRAQTVMRIDVSEGLRQFIASRYGRRKRAPREHTLIFYELILGQFIKAFPGTKWHEVEPAELEAWLKGCKPGAGRKRLQYLKIFYRWANKTAITSHNPVAKIQLPYPRQTDAETTKIGYLTPDEAQALLQAASEKVLPGIVLGLFAGIRPEELGRSSGVKKATLQWSDIKWEEKRIHIPATVAKTGRPRNIEGLPDAVWVWLMPYRECQGSVVVDYRGGLLRARERAAQTKAGIRLWDGWPHDALRHSFATFYAALTGNLGTVAKVLDHAGLSVLMDSYDGVEIKRNAELYFALKPPLSSASVSLKESVQQCKGASD